MTLQEFSDTFDTLLSAYANKPEEYGNQGSLRDIDLDEYEKSVLLTQAQDLVVKSYFDAKYNQYRDGMDDSTRRQVDFSSLITVAQPLRVTGTAGGWAEASQYFKNTYNTLQGSGNSYTYYKLIINFGNGIVTEAPYATMTGGGRTIIMNVGGAVPSQYFEDHINGKAFGETTGVDHANVNLGISIKRRDGKVVGVNVTTTSNANNRIKVTEGSLKFSLFMGGAALPTDGEIEKGIIYKVKDDVDEPELDNMDDFELVTATPAEEGVAYYVKNNPGREFTHSINGNTIVYTIPVDSDGKWKFTAVPENEEGYAFSKWNDGTTTQSISFNQNTVQTDTVYYAQFNANNGTGITFNNTSSSNPNYLGIFTTSAPVLDASSITLVSQFTSKLNHYDERGIIFQMPKNILFMLNEKVVAANTSKHYVVVPINYKEYDRQMSRAFAQPFKRQCWRLFQGVDSGIYDLNSEIIPIEGTSIDKYTIRYIRRPCPIILTDLDFSESQEPLNIDGVSVATECELNPILHMDILQKAIELAVASKGGTKSTAQQQQQQRAAQQQ